MTLLQQIKEHCTRRGISLHTFSLVAVGDLTMIPALTGQRDFTEEENQAALNALTA